MEKATVYTYDQSGGFQDADDYLYRAECQPDSLEVGQFIVGYSDESIRDAAERCMSACRKLGFTSVHFDLDLEEEEE